MEKIVFAETIIRQVGILVGAFVVKFIFMFTVGLLFDRIRGQRVKTLRSLIGNILNIVIFGTAGVMLLAEWGVSIAPILTGAGVLGLAVGFGSQSLVKDVVTGFFILIENQFNVGDDVEIAGFRGRVVELRIRTTVIKGKDGELFILPNSQLTKVTLFPKVKK